MIYIKKVISQDLERTPTFSQESWESFFKLPLANDEEVNLSFQDAQDNEIYECAIKRRATRNEIRAFIHPILTKYNAKVGDVLILKSTKKNSIYAFNFLNVDAQITELNLFFEGKNHQVIVTSDEKEDEIPFINKDITKLNSKGYNKIIYGAPGAGKSRFVSETVGENYIRTVFHPETQYSDFIGCLKPHRDSTGSITYSFREGPFINALKKALLNQNTEYFLVIEELNRANTAAVFGEIFQLLDRDEYGKSEYPILIQDKDLLENLEDTLGKEHELVKKEQLTIPSNLSIIATMNSSDQAIFPLDTAFKRRWIFEYLPIDFTNCAIGNVPIYHTDFESIEWKTLAQTINNILVQLKVVEDKLIGPWFIKNSDLVEGQAEQTFIGKICSYLWDDALKYKNKDEIFRSDIQGYGELYRLYSNKKQIFSESFINALKTEKNLDNDDPHKIEKE